MAKVTLTHPTEQSAVVTVDEGSHAERVYRQLNGFTNAPPGTPESTDGLDGHTVSELETIAATEGVDLTGVSLKADIIAAIRAARTGQEA